MSGESPQAAELEALSFTFTEGELQVVRADPLEIAVLVAPYTGDNARQQYVQTCLVLSTSRDYPAVPAAVELRDSKGLGDARKTQLITHLRSEACKTAGEMMLGHLTEAARTRLTEMNYPEGDCAFCLHPLSEAGALQLQRLPCYHCFHFWYAAEQLDRRKQRSQLVADRGHAVTHEILQQRGLLTYDHGLFPVLCPTCRTLVSPSEFSKAELKEFAAEAKKSRQGQEDSNKCSFMLPNGCWQQLKVVQERNRLIFARQLERGGIVSDQYAVAL